LAQGSRGVLKSELMSTRAYAPNLPTMSAVESLEDLTKAWAAFGNLWLLLDMLVVLLLALALGATIAYHPSARRHGRSLESFEQPKAVLMYSVVAALVALIVQVQPAMAFVIFGIGGLVRFRTLVGEAKETGRVILVTVVGLCCGLKIFVVAILATVVGWILIYFLERRVVGVIRVSGVGEETFQDATRAYRALIAGAGCRILGEQSRFSKREFVFVVGAQANLDRNGLQQAFDNLPPTLQGVVDFERL